MTAFYNEIDPYAAAWLRNLIAAGHIAAGIVDERSIVEIEPDELVGFDQCHFFAGLGGWSLALRLAGWPDSRPVWTGSCPCQPFSAAGKQGGSDDERHLWPAWFKLIGECCPVAIFGEQVAGASGLAWLDHVLADVESSGYAAAAAIVPACGVGAPHRRDRLWWFATNAKRNEQSRQEPRRRPDRRVGREQQLFPWHAGWQQALARFRVMDDGIPRCVEATDAARNAIVPQVAAAFIEAYCDC